MADAAKTNQARKTNLGEEIAVMRAVTMARLHEFIEVDARASSWSTFSIKKNVYRSPAKTRKSQKVKAATAA